jgi:hypothetical protein
MASNFDYPGTTLVDESRNTMPVWDQWFSRVQRIVASVQQSGVTADRPTSGVWIGRTYFDTTLGIPIWVQSVGPVVWVDATGAAV